MLINYNVSFHIIASSVISGRSSMVRAKPMRLEDITPDEVRLEDITPDEVIHCLCILLYFTSLKIRDF